MIISLGESLIDFIPHEQGRLSEVTSFYPVVGGAPANVAVAVAKLGGQSLFVGKVGQDSFGIKIIHTLRESGVDTRGISMTPFAKTALAFVSLTESGERDFSFYHNPSADILLDPEDLQESWFAGASIFHFGSISMLAEPSLSATRRAIKLAKKNHCLISFDPNIRLSLWSDTSMLKDRINEVLPVVDILKISEEETEFIGKREELFAQELKALIVTKGAHGVSCYTDKKQFNLPGLKVPVVDTTGAGDAFVGAFLTKVSEDIATWLEEDTLIRTLVFANTAAALTVTKKGAIAALPTRNEILEKI